MKETEVSVLVSVRAEDAEALAKVLEPHAYSVRVMNHDQFPSLRYLSCKRVKGEARDFIQTAMYNWAVYAYAS